MIYHTSAPNLSIDHSINFLVLPVYFQNLILEPRFDALGQFFLFVIACDSTEDKNMVACRWLYSRNAWSLGIQTIPNVVSIVGQEPTGLNDEWVLGPRDPPDWELCEFSMAWGSCFYPMNVFIV